MELISQKTVKSFRERTGTLELIADVEYSGTEFKKIPSGIVSDPESNIQISNFSVSENGGVNFFIMPEYTSRMTEVVSAISAFVSKIKTL